MIAIRLCAPKDINGNSRRLYLILGDDGEAVDAVDAEGMGPAALKTHYADVPVGIDVQVGLTEYRAWRSQFINPNPVRS